MLKALDPQQFEDSVRIGLEAEVELMKHGPAKPSTKLVEVA